MAVEAVVIVEVFVMIEVAVITEIETIAEVQELTNNQVNSIKREKTNNIVESKPKKISKKLWKLNIQKLESVLLITSKAMLISSRNNQINQLNLISLERGQI